jgi:uridine kinase
VHPDRHSVLEYLADAVVAVQRAHPVRVAVDGADAAGKSTLADELAGMVAARGFPVIRASIDGFHRPRIERYRLGRHSPEGYYRDSFDVEALRRELLDPLGPGGDRRYRAAVFDEAADLPDPSPRAAADPDAVLLFDGVFLQKPALDGCWELVVFVECAPEIALRRGVRRDAARMGSAAEAESRYRTRYLPGQQLYVSECRPRERAGILVINDDPLTPVVAGPRVDTPGASSLN